MKYKPFMCFFLVFLTVQYSFGSDAQSKEGSHEGDLAGHLKTGVAWGLVPLMSEVSINTAKSYLQKNKYLFAINLLAIHSNNIRRATSQHLTDNISARLESISYKVLSDDYVIKKTSGLQTDLFYRSLNTCSLLSLHAQKARKTYFRLLDIIDTVSSSARLAMSTERQDRAAALIAFAAQSMVYLHPEMSPQDVVDSIRDNFSKSIQWDKHPAFRQTVVDYLKIMDPLSQRSELINLRYCDMLNTFGIGSVDCQIFETGAILEIETMASYSDSKNTGYIKSMLKGATKDQIRNSIFILGVSIPGTFLYFLGKQHFAVDVVAKHISKIVGLATTKENMERFASQSRRTLENWGAIKTGSSLNRSSGIADHSNHYFSILQKKAGMILAEQPNFARSNIQRALELLIIHLSGADKNQKNRMTILASAAIQLHREIVEVNCQETLIRALLIAYKPLNNQSEAAILLDNIKRLDPDCSGDAVCYLGYEKLVDSWVNLTKDSDHSNVTSMGYPDQSEKESEPESEMAWYTPYLPDTESAAVIVQHSVGLGYSLLNAVAQPYAVKRFTPKTGQQSFMQLVTLYFIYSMFDFGLRSVAEPAIVHLQTVVKNWIGGTTGILEPEDKDIQNELASKVNVLNRKLSIEAQTSRSYKMTLEAMLIKCWSLANSLLFSQRYVDSAKSVAYAAYALRYYHPEFNTSSAVINAMAVGHLSQSLDQLRQRNLMRYFAEQVLLHLAELDSGLQSEAIRNSYLEILNSWGIECDQQDTIHGRDVLDTWAVYGDYMLGFTGFGIQAAVKAYVNYWGLLPRSILNFFANMIEYGTTDPLRKRVYAYSRQAMLNVITSHSPHEQMVASSANMELTDSFRRQKFYFGKPELDSRTQLVQIITSLIHCFSEARFLLAADETEKAVDQVALALVRIILYAPDMSGDDIHLQKAFKVLTASFIDQLKALQEDVLKRVGELLAGHISTDSDNYSDGITKAETMLKVCINTSDNE